MEQRLPPLLLRSSRNHRAPRRPWIGSAHVAAALPLALGALLLSSASCGSQGSPGPVPPAFDSVQAWRTLERIVAIGERESGSPGLDQLRALLAADLKAVGLTPVTEAFSEDTPVGPIDFANLYVDLLGAEHDGRPAPMVVIGSHIDTKRLPGTFVGANDGGSSTAVLLELARTLAGEQRTRPVTYRLLFLDGEEATRLQWEGLDNRYGSRHHVARLGETGQLANVKAFVLLDLCGDKNLKFFTDTNSNPELLNIFFRSARQQGLGMFVDGQRLEIKDDHLSFLEAGIPSVDLIDFDYGPRNAYWHSEEDTLDKLSAASLGATGEIVLGGLHALERWVLEQD